ncbi:mannose-1-phosphate guanylyltransferase/mannose-6-phosphate isomerase [Providencia rettgeri]|uniref:mannose-1-phosphate guanylyltransferase/mannose-6-phosphate isomerase n=1 Tax=Providencia rettgeri TaxID=587 RepID=UPI0029D63B05|nr:mannose-1-phosphate guanylyltransferase/mannose-6-phosphate isomerase [Providencia rettgeri]MDX7323554.1 mannose-1-phosphate guanylyltransferase/mannose-6-phosphate isomerase [Providencia rettgeri]
MILPIIMAGGSGSRLWPMSRTHYPKQFLSLINNTSLLQDTIKRLEGLEHLPVSLICNEEHRFLVAEQLRTLNFDYSSIILEPCGRNTAPAVALAALQGMKQNSDPILLILPADHMVKDTEAFQQAIMHALPLALDNKLVTFGILPTKPETGYGYIHCGKALEGTNAYNINSFVEKPNLQVAEQYISQSGYFWNSGMFMFKASCYLKELQMFRPKILDIVKQAHSNALHDLDFIRINKEIFYTCPDESIDYAVMENTNNAVVVPMDACWSDVGAWSSLWELGDKDESNNVLKGDIFIDDSQRCYINAPERLVAAVGVNDLVIVDTKDALLVANRDKVQNVKNIVTSLKANYRREFLHHREVYRPWGKHDHIAEGERYHVKKVVVKPGQKTALQLHYHRSEHWIVVSGTAKIYKGGQEHIITENESIYIPVGTEHYFENPGKLPLEIIEVRTGSYLAEDDIVRNQAQEDIY